MQTFSQISFQSNNDKFVLRINANALIEIIRINKIDIYRDI